MKKSRKKILTTSFLVLLLVCTLSCFDLIFSNLSYNAAAFDNPKKASLDIPSDINFIEDDKKAFISYCKQFFNSSKPLTIDSKTYTYYGTLQGRRLYRLNLTNVPYDTIYNETTIESYTFSSAFLFRPYGPGLYVIDDTGVYPLEQAYKSGMIDISQAYELYLEKSK